MNRIRLFGPLGIESGNSITTLSLGRAGRFAMAYVLCAPNQTHCRQWLASEFWTDVPAGDAKAALNTAVSRFKRNLDQHQLLGKFTITSDSSQLRIDCPEPSVIDKCELESLASEVANGMLTDPHEIYSRTCDIYPASLLPGLDQNWLIPERERMLGLYVDNLHTAMCLFMKKREFREALDCGLQILQHDRLRENIQRLLMLLYAIDGDRPKAIRHYNQFESFIKNEFDLTPSPETSELAAVIKRDDFYASLSQGVIAQKMEKNTHYGVSSVNEVMQAVDILQ